MDIDDMISVFSFKSAPDPVEWAEQNLSFSDKVSASRPGRVSLDYRPYMREPLRKIADHTVTDQTHCWATQCAKSTLILLQFAYLLDNNPLPSIFFLPNEKQARSYSKLRLQPLINENEVLSRHKSKDSDDFKLLEMVFDNLTLFVEGSNSLASLASRSAAYVFSDEAEILAEMADIDAPLNKMDQRSKSFDRNAKRVKTSSPRSRDSEFWKSLEAGSYCHYFIPCFHCGKKFIYEYDEANPLLRWDENAKDDAGRWKMQEVVASVYYECPHCARKLIDQHKPAMLSRGEWVPYNTNAAPSHYTTHLNSFYSPDVPLGKMVDQMLFAKSQLIGGWKTFRNDWLALPAEDGVGAVDLLNMLERRGDYNKGVVHEKPKCLIAALDPHRSAIYFTVRAFFEGGGSALVDNQVFATLEDAAAYIIEKKTYRLYGEDWPITIGGIDSGWDTDKIYRWCKGMHNAGFRILPTKGNQRRFVNGIVHLTDYKIGLTPMRRSLVMYSDEDFKNMLYFDCIRDGKMGWTFARDAGDEYIDQHTHESCEETIDMRGSRKRYWKKGGGQNHYADTSKIELVLWQLLRDKSI